MKTKLYFDIVYNPRQVKAVGELMSKMDLGISGLFYPQAETLSFTTTTKVNKSYIENMTKKIIEAYEHNGNDVVSVKFDRLEAVQ